MIRSIQLHITLLIPFLAGLAPLQVTAAKGHPNILLLLVDDLKPNIGCYGDPLAITPNLDRLAARGMRFDQAYCNQAVCAPSRNTLLLGSRCTSTGIYSLGRHFRIDLPDAVTLPQHFMAHGYRAESIGKVLHTGHGNHDDPHSWSVPSVIEKVVEYLEPESTEGGQLTREEAYFTNQQLGRIGALPRGMAWEDADVPDNAYADGRIADEGIRRLQAAKARPDTPFFLALGFVKPHLPFTAPRKYWELHDPNKFALAAFQQDPAGAPHYAGKRGGEIVNYAPLSVEN
ncbi:MAG: sulfatase-like hydrolase/transferase, partial [Verrucomicrobiae bacterium]|nr:sulfatase-like hydrolase/transferase [Verrucomicrobiae bacterium]